jgi:transposase InsO family protein
VCAAFVDALQRYGVPDEVLSDNGKQFTGRFTKPRPGEVLFERICRENGITALLTPPRTPTTTGRIERFHQSLQLECLDGRIFATIEEAPAAPCTKRPTPSDSNSCQVSISRPQKTAGLVVFDIPRSALKGGRVELRTSGFEAANGAWLL